MADLGLTIEDIKFRVFGSRVLGFMVEGLWVLACRVYMSLGLTVESV